VPFWLSNALTRERGGWQLGTAGCGSLCVQALTSQSEAEVKALLATLKVGGLTRLPAP
jgi:hypothetical protein